ncbi:MAB_1171c family putative transporter [Streptomyces brasiliscabiei]|uniref:MAB_1171c family putative transporter n=1 Tax=Streptomyces brasiliscabiei TaxID=2736302 RepID=A0ABU8GK50_9ACTN
MDGPSYYIPAVAMTIALASKTPALLRNRRDPLIRSVCALMTLAALVFCFAAPPTITQLNHVTGVTNISAPVVYFLLSAFSGSCLVLITNWRGGPPETTRRLSRRWIAGYGAVCAAIVLLFVLGEAPVERVRDFDTYYADTPFLREMIVLYLVGFTVAGVAMNVMCWRWALQVRGWLRAGLLIIASGFLLNIPFAAVKLIAVVARWQGADLDHLSTDVAPLLASAGAQVGAVGFCLPLAGERLDDSWTIWSMYRRLGPLWRELRPVWGQASHEVRISWWAPARLRMTQRESDIHDGMLSLYPYFDSEVRARAYDAAVASGSEPVQARAEADAAMVTAAVRAKEDDPEGRVIDSATADTPAPPAENPRDLVRMSIALRQSPVVAAAREWAAATRSESDFHERTR